MSTELRHEIEIDASPTEVWAVLTDISAYPDWNPFVRRIDGVPREGAKLDVEIVPPGGRAMSFKPTVLAAEPGRELRWLGRFLVPGLMDGEHAFRIEPIAGGRSRFTQSERFSGILVAFLKGTLRKTELGFEQMNGALKQRVEAGAARDS
jgi:hypothetical protein